MENIYYEKNGKKIGPVNLESLSIVDINAETLIWREGLNEWTKAKDISELIELLKKIPPPLPVYRMETEVSAVGFIFLLVQIIYPLLFDFNSIKEAAPLLKIGLFIIALCCRIGITYWVIDLANRQNRDTTSWGIFALFFPTPALIIIGLLKRI